MKESTRDCSSRVGEEDIKRNLSFNLHLLLLIGDIGREYWKTSFPWNRHLMTQY